MKNNNGNEKTCSQLGLDVNDSKGQNYNLICQAINDGYTIVFDNLYTVKVSSTKAVSKDINIKSTNKNLKHKLKLVTIDNKKDTVNFQYLFFIKSYNGNN